VVDPDLPIPIERSGMKLIIKKGRRKSFDIKYVEVTEQNLAAAAEWCGGTVAGSGKERYIKIVDKGAINQMQTKAFIGDVIVKHEDLGTFKKFGQKAFTKSYEEIVSLSHSRDAGTGKYVSEKYAEEHPDTTVKEQGDLPRDADPS
jgi:hypothetical protein